MKPILYIAFAIVLLSCSGEREKKDLTDGEEENISPNQTQSPSEQARKDSTQTGYPP